MFLVCGLFYIIDLLLVSLASFVDGKTFVSSVVETLDIVASSIALSVISHHSCHLCHLCCYHLSWLQRDYYRWLLLNGVEVDIVAVTDAVTNITNPNIVSKNKTSIPSNPYPIPKPILLLYYLGIGNEFRQA